ncbi:hypothetical protein KUW18_09965 [Halomonas sp. DP5Y7-2]|uniref:hypothetical protein n=1 Tax=Halomonas sp. DP5Y7-2 TaxID=2859076 RepID=UPI001C9A2370|nr:hypothetical protein [Halomonas sp. DP5Y7-2]MBY5984414.1 hypothetical protein [Halomonas sp. DP5Y7-2]
METKFLSDGREVAIVGCLNNQEVIEQGIFINEQGDEIPNGSTSPPSRSKILH